jgi:ABC-type nickel/cobalt efflux system permease component RcnA
VTLLQPLLLGLALGVRHAVEPDHLAAITTLVGGRGPLAAARTGAAWGVGHASALILLGGALVALGVRMPARLALVLDLAVAAMLLVLAAISIRAARRGAGRERAAHAHAHAHAHGNDHDHDHAREHEPARGGLRSTLVGFVHGASGTAALTVVCATTMPTRGAALGFLVVFGLGSLVSMSVMSGVLAAPMAAVARRGDGPLRLVRLAGAAVAIAAAVLVTLEATRGVV